MIEVMRGVLHALLQSTVAPAVAQSGDLDEAVKSLKRAVVAFSATQSEASKETLARHFGKSGRWVYLHLDPPAKSKRGRKKKSAASQPRPAPNALSPLGEGKVSLSPNAEDTTQSLLRHVLQLAATHYPNPLTVDEIQRHLHKSADGAENIDEEGVRSLLGLYTNMGMLKAESLGADGQAIAFAAPSRVIKTQAQTAQQRLNMIAHRAQAIFPIAMSYVMGDEEARFSSTSVRLHRRHLLAALTDCRAFIIQRFNEAVEASLDDDPDELLEGDVVDYTLLLLGGAYAFVDKAKG